MQKNLMSLAATCIAVFALFALAVMPTFGYNPPNGPNNMTANVSQPNTHGLAALKALDVLQGDGRAAVKAFYAPHVQYLLNGTRQADTGGGEFSVAGQAIPKNSFTHFYNPATGKGFVLDFGEYNSIKSFVSFLSLAPWKYLTLKGPHPSMADMADWYYAQAVRAIRQGNTAQAMTYLGYVLHYVSDATVPQHVADEGAQKPGSQHVEYENYCDNVTKITGFPHAANGGMYKPDSWTPSQYVKDAASYSKPLLSKAKSPSQFAQACNPMVPLAEKYCAGILDRFYRLRNSEQFSVVVVTIDRVKAVSYWIKSKELDYPDDADFYAYVTIDGRQYDTGVVDGTDDMSPQTILPYVWVFPKWISATSGTKQIKFAVWDDDGITGDDKAYICPKSGEKELWINYNLATGAVTGDTSANKSGTKTSVHTKGNHDGDEAEIWFNIQKWP